jgi:hypothetical protein
VSLRGRLTLVAAGVVAVVVAIAAATTYFVMRHELLTQVDASLLADARSINVNNLDGPGAFGGNSAEIVRADKTVVATNIRGGLPVDAAVVAVAAGRQSHFFRDVTITRNDKRYALREFVAPIVNQLGESSGEAALVVRNLEETDGALDRLALILLLVSVGAIGRDPRSRSSSHRSGGADRRDGRAERARA